MQIEASLHCIQFFAMIGQSCIISDESTLKWSRSEMSPNMPSEDANITFLSGLRDTFRFHCKACGQCCGQYRIVLSPYDIIHLRKATGRTTHDLIDRGTVQIVHESFKRIFGFAPIADLFDSLGLSQSDTLPVALLGFRSEDAGKSICEFLSPRRHAKRLCTIYENRPTMCRLHPLGCTTVAGRRLWFFQKPLCKPDQGCTQTVEQWICTSHLRPFLRANSSYLKWLLDLMAESEHFNRISATRWRMLERILFDFDSLEAGVQRSGAVMAGSASSNMTRAPSMRVLDRLFYSWLSEVRSSIR
ncbi:MAG: YkgJ family cysteine cluster protein [Candidatus Abyssobacteria bacterium SURF_17]|uniref:YkgJ family cysteine cluster protein n=1 Tax=Candidatus Abyssobacteria bacterium SURF_17 TaxID=2093361 RepID=A0A419EN45_9BACT|nr:MAG: YkgJ family cysteine cluster protein [Candidatus Abyssubacteria bacterium SURF_17]